MDFGLALPTSGTLASPSNITQMAQAAEQIGYASVWTYERLMRPKAPVMTRRGGMQVLGEDSRVCYDPLETLSYVAAITNKVKLGTSIINALFHSPIVLARRFATLDQFSDGRVIAGLGQGWMAQEFDAVNVPMSRRGSGVDDAVAAIRACWGPDPVEYQGNFYQIPASDINPKPVQENLPIIMGSMTPAGVKRAARIADGLNVIADSFEVVNELVSLFLTEVAANGRNPDDMMIVVRANTVLTRELIVDRPFLSGTPEEIAKDVLLLREIPVQQVFFDNENPTGDLAHDIALYGELFDWLNQSAV